ncbi:MAG: carbon monoxide dehydrogenase subunit G [Rhizomicrobium sp.]
MEFTGRYIIPASPEAVWAAINDAEILQACIPGCERMEKTDAAHFVAATTLKIGPVKATFKGRVELSEMDPPRRCVLKGEGQGGVAGFARGEAEVMLAPDGEGTALSYVAKATVGGKLAQIGQRLIDGAAKQIADNFFSRFAAVLTATPAGAEAATREAFVPGQEPAVVAPPPLVEAAPPIEELRQRREGLAPEVWVIGLIAVIVILLLLFGLVL